MSLRIWRELAPTALSRASSRNRWLMVIPKTLLMMNAAHEGGHEREHQQAGSEDADDTVDTVGCFLADLFTGDDFEPIRQNLRDRCLHGRRVGALRDLEVDDVELAGGVQDRLCALGVEQCRRRTAEPVALPSPTSPTMSNDCWPPSNTMSIGSPTAYPTRSAVALSMTSSPMPFGARPSFNTTPAKLSGPDHDNPSAGAPLRAHRFAVGIEQLRISRQTAFDETDTVDLRDLVGEACRNRVAHGVVGVDRELGTDLEVDILVELGEEVVERRLQAVCQHERAGDERHAERDGETDEDVATGAGPHRASRERADHVSVRSASCGR